MSDGAHVTFHLCHAVTGNHLADIELSNTASISDLYVATAEALHCDTSVLHLLHQNEQICPGDLGQLNHADEGIIEAQTVQSDFQAQLMCKHQT